MKPAANSVSRPASRPAPNFDPLARLYRWMEYLSFGPWLWRCRCAFLPQLTACRRALVLGDGDGRFTARLLRANPAIEIDAIDASPAMLHALQRRAGPHVDRVRTHRADARLWTPPTPPCDLIVTHFFLDCLGSDEIAALAATLHLAAAPGAMWVVSEFAVPAGLFGQLVARPVVAGLYWAFGWMTGLAARNLPDHAAALRRAGFALQKQRTWLGGLLVSQLWVKTSCQDPLSGPIVMTRSTQMLQQC